MRVGKKEIESEDFTSLLGACQEIASAYPDGIVFIGGIAVYMHAINHETTRSLAEFTHDADFYISLADMSDLRDAEEVTPNRRLSKHPLIKRGFEFDIYTERQSSLIVPYDQVIAHAVVYDGVKVSGIEHLMVLKLEAYRDRYASSKGQKDAKDLIRLALIAHIRSNAFDANVCLGYLRDEHLDLLDRVAKGHEFLALAKGNAKEAKGMRQKFVKIVEQVRRKDKC